MERTTRIDSGLLTALWCQSIEVAMKVCNMIYNATLKVAPDWIWDQKPKYSLFKNMEIPYRSKNRQPCTQS